MSLLYPVQIFVILVKIFLYFMDEEAYRLFTWKLVFIPTYIMIGFIATAVIMGLCI